MSVKAKLILGLIGFILIGCLVQQSIYTQKRESKDSLEQIPTVKEEVNLLEASVRPTLGAAIYLNFIIS